MIQSLRMLIKTHLFPQIQLESRRTGAVLTRRMDTYNEVFLMKVASNHTKWWYYHSEWLSRLTCPPQIQLESRRTGAVLTRTMGTYNAVCSIAHLNFLGQNSDPWVGDSISKNIEGFSVLGQGFFCKNMGCDNLIFHTVEISTLLCNWICEGQEGLDEHSWGLFQLYMLF